MTVISIFLSLFSLFSISKATTDGGGRDGNGFTTSLFHRDSLRNSSLSHYDRLINAFRRSISRSTTIFNRVAAISTTGIIHAPVIPDDGEFVTSISLGTPPVDFTAFVDTGSDLIWTQCLPCIKCFNQSFPIFNPRKSSSYRHVRCSSNICRSLDYSHCGPNHRTCRYDYYYADGSFTHGDIAFDKITIGSFELPMTAIGCGHLNKGPTFHDAMSGIIGLGTGPFSLVSQMSKIANVKRRFSYCLPTFFSNLNVKGKINFGQNAIVSGSKVVSTPIIMSKSDPFYYSTLEAISVANKRFEATSHNITTNATKQGNILIDSGTTLTFLPQILYNNIVSTLVSVIIGAKRVDDPSRILELCYAATDINDLNIPIITFHFAGNAYVNLLPLNTFIPVSPNVACLTFMPTSNSAILGNLAQVHFLIGYDLEMMKMSFKYTVCA